MGLVDQIINEYRTMDDHSESWFSSLDILYYFKILGIGTLSMIIMLLIVSILWFGYVSESEGVTVYSEFVIQLLNLSEDEWQVFSNVGVLNDESIFPRIIESDRTGFLMRVVIVVLLSVFLIMVMLLVTNSITTKSDLKKDAKHTQICFEYDRYRLVEIVKWCSEDCGLYMNNQQDVTKTLKTLYETLKSQTETFKEGDYRSDISFGYFFNCMTLCFSCTSLFLTLRNSNLSVMMIVFIIMGIAAGGGVGYLALRIISKKPHYHHYITDLSDTYLKKYFMTLLEDVVFFNIPVKEYDMDGRVAAWKEQKEILKEPQKDECENEK